MQTVDIHTKCNQVLANIIGQIVGIICGIILIAVDPNYKGFQSILGSIVSALFCAGLIRLIIVVYRFTRIHTARRIYNELGECVGRVPRPVLPVLIVIAVVSAVVFVLILPFRVSEFMGNASLILVLLLIAFLFARDISLWVKLNKQKKEELI